MKYIIFIFLSFSAFNCFISQQLLNSNMETWITESYGQEPGSWQYNDGTGLVYGTNNFVRSIDGIDPLTTSKITGVQAFGGTGNSALLETKSAVGSYMLTNGYTTIPGYLYSEDVITNTNIGSITFKYKTNVIQGDSCFVKVGLFDANYNLYSLGTVWFKPNDNSNNWQTKTLILNQLLPGVPNRIFIEAMSTYDESYTYATSHIGSKLYLDNFNINYCSPSSVNISETVCNYMLPYTWNGVIFNTAGTQSATLSNSLGCDSIVSMTLSVVNGPHTQIPDPVFEQKLIDLGLDPCGVVDGLVPTNSIDTVTSLSITNGNGIVNLTGIEDFISLQGLTLFGANLQNNGIDLTNNIQLRNLSIIAGLTSLNLSQNTNLEWLSFFGTGIPNNISILDLSSNIYLQNVNCTNASIQSLFLPNSATLVQLTCSQNSIGSINLGNVPNLQSFYASNNNLISLGTNVHNSIQYMDVSNNGFTGLNLSDFNQLINLNCSGNNLECLNIKNGKNNQFTDFSALNNFNLTCIEVDDSTFSTNNPIWNTGIDAWGAFSENCTGSCFTASIQENMSELFYLFPNPCSGILSINNPKEENIYYNIRDIQGRLIKSGYLIPEINSIEISELNNGKYFISLGGQIKSFDVFQN
jgi:hypothetical protein